MSRRSALLIALAVGLAAAATLLLARRGRAINAAATPPLPPLEPPVRPTPAVRSVREPQVDAGEQPLPTWARVAIVAAGLLAFLAVSMIATRNS